MSDHRQRDSSTATSNGKNHPLPLQSKTQYRPRFSQPPPPIPSIDKFKLNHILSHELKQESEQVVESLLKVSKNYKKDLKDEIRLKLSIEQKLQNKNIQVAKLASSINKSIDGEIKSISKQIDGVSNGHGDKNAIDSEVLPVVELAESVSQKFSGLSKKLQRIDKKINGEKGISLDKYPLLSKYFSPQVVPKEAQVQQQQRSQDETNTKATKPPVSTPNDAMTNKPQGSLNISFNLTHNDPVPNNQLLPSHSSSQPPPVPNPTSSHNPPNILIDDEEMNPEDFEAFMSETLTNYRKQQQERYKSLDVFLTPEDESLKSSSGELYNDPHFDRSLSSSFHRSEDPVSFLYVNPKIKETANGKSPAIVTQTLQTSHFKKLRISGSPITSASFLKKRDQCECHSNNKQSSEVPGIQVLRNLAGSQSPSPSFEPDDDLSDGQMLSSQSSETDSSDSSHGLAGDTDNYYTSLHESFKQKRKKKLIQRSRRLRDNYKRDYSPTPKHEPSHRILRPKASILKLPTSTNVNVLPKSVVRNKSRVSTSPCPRPSSIRSSGTGYQSDEQKSEGTLNDKSGGSSGGSSNRSSNGSSGGSSGEASNGSSNGPSNGSSNGSNGSNRPSNGYLNKFPIKEMASVKSIDDSSAQGIILGTKNDNSNGSQLSEPLTSSTNGQPHSPSCQPLNQHPNQASPTSHDESNDLNDHNQTIDSISKLKTYVT